MLDVELQGIVEAVRSMRKLCELCPETCSMSVLEMIGIAWDEIHTPVVVWVAVD
jgi:DNA-binding IclR family transcriptional regulator